MEPFDIHLISWSDFPDEFCNSARTSQSQHKIFYCHAGYLSQVGLHDSSHSQYVSFQVPVSYKALSLSSAGFCLILMVP